MVKILLGVFLLVGAVIVIAIDTIREWREWIWEKKNKITIEEKYKTQEIKPCPFCGSEAKCYNLSTINDPAHYVIMCPECWASIPAGDSEEETTNRWNRRVNND